MFFFLSNVIVCEDEWLAILKDDARSVCRDVAVGHWSGRRPCWDMAW